MKGPWETHPIPDLPYQRALWPTKLVSFDVLCNESGQTGWARRAKAEISWCFVSSSNAGAPCAAMTLVVFAQTPSWVRLINWKWIESTTQSSVTGQGQKVRRVATIEASDIERWDMQFTNPFCQKEPLVWKEKQCTKCFSGTETISENVHNNQQ